VDTKKVMIVIIFEGVLRGKKRKQYAKK